MEIKYTLICKDGYFRTALEPHGGTKFGRWWERSPKRELVNGQPMVNLRKGKYSLKGRTYRYEYRLMRSFFLAKHTGLQMVWKEGNPAPLDFNSEDWKSSLDDTAFMVWNITETNVPERLMAPPRLPWVMIVLACAFTGMLAFVIGQAIH